MLRFLSWKKNARPRFRSRAFLFLEIHRQKPDFLAKKETDKSLKNAPVKTTLYIVFNIIKSISAFAFRAHAQKRWTRLYANACGVLIGATCAEKGSIKTAPLLCQAVRIPKMGQTKEKAPAWGQGTRRCFLWGSFGLVLLKPL